jgi:hypothetical protein
MLVVPCRTFSLAHSTKKAIRTPLKEGVIAKLSPQQIMNKERVPQGAKLKWAHGFLPISFSLLFVPIRFNSHNKWRSCLMKILPFFVKGL